MSDMRVANNVSSNSSPAVLMASLDGIKPGSTPAPDKGQLAQAETPTKPPTKEQKKKWADEWAKQKAADPNTIANLLGMPYEQAAKVLNEVGISTDRDYFDPLDRIAEVTAYGSPASLGSNWEQKTAFLTAWTRKTTNDVAVSTQGIQVTTQLAQIGAITNNEARSRIAGYTLKAQTASARLNVLSSELGRVELTTRGADAKLSVARLKLQADQALAGVLPALKTANINLDTINKNVKNQAAGVANTATANVQQLENLRLRALDKIRAASPEPRVTSDNPTAPSLESDPKSGVALPNIPTSESGLVSKSSTLGLIQNVLPITKNGKPAELKSSPTPGAGIGVPEVATGATEARRKIESASVDLVKFAGLSDKEFKIKFGDSRAGVQRELDAIKQNKPVAIDTRGLLGPAMPKANKIDWSGELQAAKAYANSATNLSPAVKKFIIGMDEKTMSQFDYVAGLAIGGEAVKLGKTAIGIRNLGRKASTDSSGKFNPAKFADKVMNVLPSADLTQLNNLFGQVARNKNFAETMRSYNLGLQSEKIASQGLNLSTQAYTQSVTAMRQGAEQNKQSVANFQTSYKNLQTQMRALELRKQNLNISGQQLAVAEQSLKATSLIGNVSIATAQANNKVASQGERITKAIGQNNVFMSNLNNVVSAGQDYNMRSLSLHFKQAPPAVVMTTTGLVVPTKILNESLNSVQAAAGRGAARVRYDTPAVLALAQRKTHEDFSRAHPAAAAVLLSKNLNAVGMASASILREGKYDAARQLMPVNLTATPSAIYTYKYLPPKVVWGQAAPPASASRQAIPPPPDDVLKDFSQEQIDSALHSSPNRRSDSLEPPRRAP